MENNDIANSILKTLYNVYSSSVEIDLIIRNMPEGKLDSSLSSFIELNEINKKESFAMIDKIRELQVLYGEYEELSDEAKMLYSKEVVKAIDKVGEVYRDEKERALQSKREA